jgi:hypothetical protein
LSILEPAAEEQSSSRRKALAVVVLVAVVAAGFWYVFRYYPEKRAVDRFFVALTAGDTARAYQIWQPGPTYKMEDFLSDWGPNGFYGPVKSFRIVSARSPKHGGSGVIITVDVSPFTPLPAEGDIERSRRTRRVQLWVETSNKSISFPPL